MFIRGPYGGHPRSKRLNDVFFRFRALNGEDICGKFGALSSVDELSQLFNLDVFQETNKLSNLAGLCSESFFLQEEENFKAF